MATRVLAETNTPRVAGLVLESPFNNMEDEVRHFRLARWTIWALGVDLAATLRQADVEFRTDGRLGGVGVPVLVLHARDDPIVPHRLGEQLVNTTRVAGKQDITMVSYDSELRLHHRYIYRAPDIEVTINQFLLSTEN